jgi:acetyl-CoA carboxylase, biotin carboxylase subunit
MSLPRRLLIANRGEIAVRVARAARDLGIETVAVYSSADADSSHVRLADRAVCIGPPAATASYLCREALVHVAESTGCDAVHPGYGFLAEDATFAQQVEDAGLAWVGPAPGVIRQMGDKAAARTAAVRADVPVVPGSDGLLGGHEEAEAFGRRHGYPLLLKASAGGGGKGMRVVEDEHQLPRVLALARQEAAGAFGDDGMYVERYLRRVRHVEVQVIGDGQGHVVALGERDCSVQRRHQKVVEEAPSQLPAGSRQAMSDTAARLAASVKYGNAGTVEFLVDADTGDFHFIEMNTRIQVEHPVTEMVTGIDLVKSQLLIAAGAKLSEILPVPRVEMRGHAIECRINAEHPEKFTPSAGKITVFNPPGGIGVRVDTNQYAEGVVPPYYDSMIGKLITHGKDREEAMARMSRALDMFVVEGIYTTIPLHQRILKDPDFRAGNFDTKFMERFLAPKEPKP